MLPIIFIKNCNITEEVQFCDCHRMDIDEANHCKYSATKNICLLNLIFKSLSYVIQIIVRTIVKNSIETCKNIHIKIHVDKYFRNTTVIELIRYSICLGYL